MADGMRKTMKAAKEGTPERMPCPIEAQSPILISLCAEHQVRHDAGERVPCKGPECIKYLVNLQDAPDVDALARELAKIEKAARNNGAHSTPNNIGKKTPSALPPPRQEAKAAPASTSPESEPEGSHEPEAKGPEFDRPLPKGAVVTVSGIVKVGYNPKVPCPSCPKNWINKYGKTRECRKCSIARDHKEGRTATRTAKARQARAAKHSPEPKIRAAKDTPRPNHQIDSLLETLSQQLAAKVRARTAEILGLEVLS